MPILIDLWLESSPNVFSAGSIGLTPSLAVMHTVLKMMNLSWRAMIVGGRIGVDESWTTGWFKTILKHFVVHFPFGRGNFSLRDSKVCLHVIFQCQRLVGFVGLVADFLGRVRHRWNWSCRT